MTVCLKVPTTASWSNKSCNRSAAPFKTMWTQYGNFGKLEVSDDNSEPVRNPDAKSLGLCGDESLKLGDFLQTVVKAKLHSIAYTGRKRGCSYGKRTLCL